MLTATLRLFAFVWLRPRVTGREHVPVDGAVIVASNHLSAIDTLCLSVLLPRRVKFLAKAEYFNRLGIRGRLMAWLMSTCGFVPVDRSSPAAGKDALDAGSRVLSHGGVLGLYPEGTRSPDGRLYRGRTGVARLALMSGAPVLPVALKGTREALPTGSRWPRPKTIEVHVASPLVFELGGRSPHNSAVLRATTDAVMAAIGAMSGQARADGYAAPGSPDRG